MTRDAFGDNVIGNMLRLLTFGGLDLELADGSAAPRLRPPMLALLAILAAAGDRGVSRERLAGLFWPDSDDAHARHALRQRLYSLRSDLNEDVVRPSSAALMLEPAAITADVIEFRTALAAGDRARAAALVRGPFLDGFYLAGLPEFERWVEEERARLTEAATSSLVSLATEATLSSQRDDAVRWWRHLTILDPLSGRYALGYLKALGANGDRAKALAFAREHEALVRRELETDPDPDVRRLEAELRSMPSPEVTRRAVLSTTSSRPTGEEGDSALVAPPPTSASPLANDGRVRLPPRPALWMTVAVGVLALLVMFGLARQRGWLGGTGRVPTLAVGFIREEGVPDSMRVGRVLTDMLATNLARIDGLSVLANSRLLEVMRPGQDSSVGYSQAARLAGATQLLEGRLLITPHAVLALEMRQVELSTGIVKDVYRVSAIDRYALVDSLTQAMASRLRLTPPGGTIGAATTASPMAYRFYEEGLRAYLQSDLKAAQRLMHAALEEDSTFAMAAYYELLLAVSEGDRLLDGTHVADARRRTLRLAARAPERDRLTIIATLLQQDMDTRALVVAESLVAKYGNDPRALMTVGNARSAAGNWRGAIEAMERAIALDSVAETSRDANCRLCQDLAQLAGTYFWWDSLPAAERTARRYLRAIPQAGWPHWIIAGVAARAGDSAKAIASYRSFRSAGGADPTTEFTLDLTLEDYEELERDVRPYLTSSVKSEWNNGAWTLAIALRNQGRLADARQFLQTGRLAGFPSSVFDPGPMDDFNKGILALEGGDGRGSAAVFERRLHFDNSHWAPGYQARHLAWNGALQGMGLAAAGDTSALKVLADSVEKWGRGSSYGRDRKVHHYLRGLVFAAGGHHEDAARQYQAAIFSPSNGFTRVNYELARSLLKLDRPREAVATLQSALRGEVDASNLYITRTDLHELLAQAFDRANMPDSAAAHYRAVLRAWRRPDPIFQARRDAVQNWLAHRPSAGEP